MEELPQDQVEKQVHNDPVPAEPEYTLEEIMREFGGWSKREDEPAKPETMPESAETENSPPPQAHDGQAPAPQRLSAQKNLQADVCGAFIGPSRRECPRAARRTKD